VLSMTETNRPMWSIKSPPALNRASMGSRRRRQMCAPTDRDARPALTAGHAEREFSIMGHFPDFFGSIFSWR
jgi:hypothetical protein